MNLYIGYIYCIRNKTNNKCYIGQTIHTIEKRWKQHIKKNNNCRYLKNAFHKYGFNNFEINVVAECDNDKLDDCEKEYIIEYNSLAPNGYNLREGGNNGKMHEETKQKISATLKENWNNKTEQEKEEQIEKFFKATEIYRTDTELKKENYEKISNTLKAKPITQEKKEQLNKYKAKFKVYQYDEKGKLINEFESLTEAASVMKTCPARIERYCISQNLLDNFIFKLHKYQVVQKDEQNKIVNTFDCIENAAKYFNVTLEKIFRRCQDKKMLDNYYLSSPDIPPV
jgi:group I intron endonuclease